MQRAMKNIKVSDSGCWEWQAGKNAGGYGKLGRKTNGKMKHYIAHRYFYEKLVGPIPDHLCVMHKCDNRVCCNPEHLMLGTQAENIADCVSKGRNYKGPKPWAKGVGKREEHYRAKITQDDAKTMRHLYFAERRTLKEIGDYFGMVFQSVSRIVRKERWA